MNFGVKVSIFTIYVSLTYVIHLNNVEGVWPPWEPLKPPFFDANCLGKPFDVCLGDECQWRTQQTPACWSKYYSSIDLPPTTKANFNSNPVPISVLLFTQNFVFIYQKEQLIDIIIIQMLKSVQLDV